MKTITIKEGCSTPVNIGEKGENGVGAVLFDYSEWLNDFGNGAISLLVKRKGDTAAYPVVLTTADGIATWTISDTDTAVQGYGKAEYIFTIDDKVAKSAVFSFFVAHDLGPQGDPPDPYESWIDTLTALGGETLINAQAAQAAQEAAETAQTAAETAATNAATSATNAAQSAGAARFAAESALASSDSASASATTATTSASAASESATQAAASASATEASETAAYDSANTAAEEAEVARTAATQAQTSASNAYDYAAQAMEAASDASAAEQTASASATTASNAAQSATTSANNAAQSASNASQSATQAASSATNAASSATSASGSATNAATSESNAADSATSAAASATEAATEAAKLNNYLPTDTASGAIASFSDGADSVPVEALSVALEPIQDLNGQSSPYPAGGGKNKFNIDVIDDYTSTSGAFIVQNGNGSVTVTANAYSPNINCGKTLGELANLTVGETYTLTFETTGTTNYIYLNGSSESWTNGTNKTITQQMLDGNVFFYASGAGTSATISKVMIRLSSVTDATFAPYENICPITGHEACEVWRAGKNLYDKTTYPFQRYSQYNTSACWTQPIFLKAGTYTFKCASGFGNNYLNVYATYSDAESNTNRVEQPTFVNSGYITKTFSEDRWVRYQQNATGGTDADYAIVTNSWQTELGSTATDYETPNVQHIEIPLGQTVYGGTVDVVGGVVTVDRAMVTFDGSADESWTLQSINSYGIANFYTNFDHYPAANYRTACNMLSPQTSGISTTETEGYFVHQNGTTAYIRISSTRASTVEAWRTWLGQNNIQLVYELATPITIDLSDIPTISTLLGQNNIWSDSGDVSVTYRADIQKYIAKVIAEALA